MRQHFILLTAFVCLFATKHFAQQYWEHEFLSEEEKNYRATLKKNKVKKIYFFFHYKKGAPAIAKKALNLDKNGNVLSEITMANQDFKKDFISQENKYDQNGNLLAHYELSFKSDTTKYVLYKFDSLNNLTEQFTCEDDYKENNGKIEVSKKNSRYLFRNFYNPSGKLETQEQLYNGKIILIKKITYDLGNRIIEIKITYPGNGCIESWMKFSYYPDGRLKDKLYPSHSCNSPAPISTMNNNKYIYTYDSKGNFTQLEHRNHEDPRGKIFYTYNSSGLLTYFAPDDDFGYYDYSLKYEFFK
jgi:hypothetical protein